MSYPYELITEPILGIIRVRKDSVVHEILETPSKLNMLHHIDQIPFGTTISPYAYHSRFIHSLGVYWIAHNLARHLELKCPERYDITGLLHDVGYLKLYYHSLENNKGEHEDVSRRLIVKEFGEILEKYGYNPKEIVELTKSEIIEWSDRLEYVKRDSVNSGIGIFAPRWDSIAYALWLKDRKLHLVDNDGRNSHIYGFGMLFKARSELAEKLYHHDSPRCLGSLLKKAVEIEGIKYDAMKDHYLLGRLGSSKNSFSQDVYQRINSNRPYDLILRIERNEAEKSGLLSLAKDGVRRREFEDEIFKKTRIHVIVDSTPKMKPWEIFPVLTEDKKSITLEEFDPPTHMIIKESNQKIEELDDFRIYGEKRREELKTLCEELLSSFTKP